MTLIWACPGSNLTRVIPDDDSEPLSGGHPTNIRFYRSDSIFFEKKVKAGALHEEVVSLDFSKP